MITALRRPRSAENIDGLTLVRPRAAKTDFGFVALVGLGLLLVASLPFVAGQVFSSAEKQFMGLPWAVHDYTQYMSWARESIDKVLVENKLTPEQTAPGFFNLLWWVLGRAEGYLGLNFFALNQIMRVLAIGAFVFAAHRFCLVTLKDRTRQRYALVLTCVAAGFGWVLVPLKYVTGDLLNPTLIYNGPGNTMVGAAIVPHQILAAAILVTIFLQVLAGYRHSSTWRLAVAGLLGLVLGLMHTYDLVTAYAVVGAFALLVVIRDGLRLRWVLGMAAFYGLSCPAPLFWLYLSASSPAWRQVLAQFRNLNVFTPDPLQLIVLLGAPFLLAIATFRGFVPIAKRRTEELFLYAWLCVVLLVIYVPVTFQIMMLNGLQVALGVLATRGLFDHMLPWLREGIAAWRSPTVAWLRGPRLTVAIGALFLAIVVPTNLYLIGWRILDLSRREYPEFLYRDDVAALNWLAERTQPADVILSSMEIGHYVPGWTGGHAFLAHGAATLEFNSKRMMVADFFAADTSDAERQGILQGYGVRYIIQGPAERRFGTYDPATAAYLRVVFVTPHTRVFEVVNDDTNRRQPDPA